MPPFIDWLRSRAGALVSRRAAARLRRRMQRAQAELSPQMHAEAAYWRERFLAREARLQRERTERGASRESRAARQTQGTDIAPGQTIEKSEVLAAIARGRARRRSHTSNEMADDGGAR